ncbi:YciI family protein, partial [Pseudomonas aeruginosa]
CMFQLSSLELCIECVKRCPNSFAGESEIEVSPVFEAEAVGEEFTPELREREERLRDELEKRN